MAECERRLNQFIKAIEFLESAIDLDPNLPVKTPSDAPLITFYYI
jgi:hypothetical protein